VWPIRIFENHVFPAENAGSVPEIAVFADLNWAFSNASIKHDSIVNKTFAILQPELSISFFPKPPPPPSKINDEI